MFRKKHRLGSVLCLIASSCLTMTLSTEESYQDSDWPCEQILVPEVPAAVVWAGPSIAGLETAWQQDSEVAGLVGRLTSPDYNIDGADADIEQFAGKQKPVDKDHMLTLLFTGVHQTLNEERSKRLDGIMRYSRGQAERANRLSQDLDEMIKLQDDSSAEAQERLTLMQKEMELKQRMFDEREMFIQHLCTRPMVIEQKLGVLARTIAYYLD